MASASSQSSAQYQALYRSTVEQAAAGGSLLMGKLVAAARTSLQTQEAACRELRERDALAQSARQLRNWESELCRRYPKALLDAFSNPDATKKAGTQSIATVEFDELELMDEVQVQTSVTLARTQQIAMMAAEASLAELNTLICSTLGMGAVNADRNPLRPQIYISALQSVVEQTQLPPAMQLDWLGAMSATLGHELRKLYTDLSHALRSQGVVAASYAVVATPSGLGIGRGVAQDAYQVPSGQAAQGAFLAPNLSIPTAMAATAPALTSAEYGPGFAPAPSGSHGAVADDTLLTLDKLRRLLSGELGEPVVLSAKERFARQFAREFEEGETGGDAPATDFDSTVPAALEALKELQQVDAFVQRIEHRRSGVASSMSSDDTPIEAIRAHLRSQADGLAQTLSLEVVSLMVDNIARDERLLVPVQQLIRRMEPALLLLAMVDPRLFTNRQHPARVLVQEVADHSMAYASVEATGFAQFVEGVTHAIAPLEHDAIEDAEPFEYALHQLQHEWKRTAVANARNREQAMRALQHAEQRNLLAEKVAREIAAHPDALRVPALVVDFLCGPWAQVVAQARIQGESVQADADKYQALISALLWSTHPELTRKNIAKLTRLVPRLLGTLREGLDTIRYPATKTSAFLEALMGLHQQAFRAAKSPQVPPPAPEADAPIPSVRANLVDEGNPWVAPQEAQASNFIELPDPPASDRSAPTSESLPGTPGLARTAPEPALASLPLGSWIELKVQSQWVRTQLTWASPHGTLFLFTNAQGATQSMTRRSGDKLVAAGQLRVISNRPVVDGALNAVAQMALRNSVNTGF